MSSLECAIALAAVAHEGQEDKAGAKYILHPIRVMLRLNTDEERIVGVLHDVVEDCREKVCGQLGERHGVPASERDIYGLLRLEGFSENVIKALESVTKRDDEMGESDEAYFRFIDRACRNAIGRRVKLADLEDNCDLSRISNPSDKDEARITKYARAKARILEAERLEGK